MNVLNTLTISVRTVGALAAEAALAALVGTTRLGVAATTSLAAASVQAAGALATQTASALRTAEATGRATTSQALYTSTIHRSSAAITAWRATAVLMNGLLGVQGLALGAITYGLYSSTRSYQDYNAQLKIATGSQEGANIAFDALLRYAKETPYSLDQSVNAFTRLINLGLTPSERALRSYGNTASMFPKKSLMDWVEAVADATSLQFRRLREFGIVAEKDGEKVNITFRNMTTTVGANAKAIEGYLLKLGENEFANSMSERMKTLRGVTAQVGDEWSKLWMNLSKTGADNIITSAVISVLHNLEELNKQLESGQLQQNIHALAYSFSGFAEGARYSFSLVKDFVDGFYKWLTASQQASTDTFETSWKSVPVFAAAMVKNVGNELGLFLANAKVTADAFSDYFSAQFVYVYESAKANLTNAGRLAAQTLAYPWMMDQAKEEFAKRQEADKKARDETIKNALAAMEARSAAAFKANDEAYQSNRERIAKELIDEYDANKAKYEVAEKLRKDFEDKLAQKKGDVLGQFAKPAPPGEKQGEETDKAAKKSAIERLEEQLMTEKEKILYSYQERKDLILSTTERTEIEKTNLLLKITKEREDQLRALEQKKQAERLGAAKTFFANIASIGSAFGEKGFKIAKAAAIAEATINSYTAATAAYRSLATIPYVGPYLGAAAAAAAIAAGAANIAQIRAQQYTGAYAEGGYIPRGGYGLVGEQGPEFVQGPAYVTSARETKSIRESGSGGVTVNVYNLPGQTATVKESTNPMGERELQVIIERVEQKFTADAQSGGGKFVPTMASAFRLQRGGRL